MGKRLFLIINSRSGTGLIKNALIDILEIFGLWDFDITIHITKSSGDAAYQIETRAREFDLIVCCGGDGIVNEAFSVLSSIKNAPPLGIIPCGTTNDFSHSLAIPTDPIAAANVICTGVPFKCDCGKFNDRIFSYVAAFGLFTNVTYETPQESKNVLGRTAYIFEAIKNLPIYIPHRIKLECEHNSFEDEYILGMITNTVSIGGFRTIFESIAELNDGFFEVTLVKAPKTFADFQKVTNILTKTSKVETEVTDFLSVVHAKKLHISCDESIPWTLDGEEGGVQNEIDIEVLPKAVTIIVSRDSLTNK